MNKTGIWYIDERAAQLAIVYLTRRDDLMVMHPRSDETGLDYLVQIQRKDQQSLRRFGVIVDGIHLKDFVEHTNDDAFKPLNGTNGETFPDIPICALVFVMENDTGFYRWVREPVVTNDGEARLVYQHNGHFTLLTTEALATIVASVHAWYDAQEGKLEGENVG